MTYQVMNTFSKLPFILKTHANRPGIPPVNKFYVSQDTPVKPVRQYYPPGFDAPEFQTDYYTFNYSVPADIFTPPEVCK